MPDIDADKKQSTLLVLFIPSADRFGKSIGRKKQDQWVHKALTVLGTLMGGATAYPRGLGVWRDDAQGGDLVWDKPVLIQCYTTEETIEQQAGNLRQFLVEMGAKTRQGAVGFVIDRDYFETHFPLENNP
ncbi:MAG TPA: hypothetical protein VGZ47_11140 [Gemmataceae bacterium]|jgi:hypothetical protein|nr:hypothetical protein [Gemmataceae bacterium]